ncbi:MAG: NPCBM/NEW2 domain-containing protein [Butyrivibrio sp.]
MEERRTDIVCPECGTVNEQKSRFCIKCGTNIEEILDSGTNITREKKKKLFIIPIVIVALLVIAAGVFGINFLSEKNSYVNKVVEYIEAGDYSNAKSVYDEKIKDDPDKYEKLAENLREHIEENKNLYYEEQITYEQMKDIITAIKSLSMKSLSNDISAAEEYVDKIHDSRTAFKSAEHYMEKNDYKNAIINYSNVDVEDSYFDTAKSRKQEAVNAFRTAVLADAATYASEGDYLSAIAVLKEADKILENDTDIQIQIKAYEVDQDNNIINGTIEKAKSYYNNGDYSLALNELDKLSGYNNEVVNDLHEKYYGEFLTYVLNEAETAFNSSGHTAALNKLNEYSNYFSEDTAFTDKKEYYTSLAPVRLTSMDYFSATNRWNYSSYEEDYLGNSFEDCIVSKGDARIEYYVNRQYKSISGTIAYCNEGLTYGIYKIEIYGDDELIYSSPNVNAKTDPFNFTVDITDKKFIKIEFVDIEYTEWRYSGIIDSVQLNKY